MDEVAWVEKSAVFVIRCSRCGELGRVEMEARAEEMAERHAKYGIHIHGLDWPDVFADGNANRTEQPHPPRS